LPDMGAGGASFWAAQASARLTLLGPDCNVVDSDSAEQGGWRRLIGSSTTAVQALIFNQKLPAVGHWSLLAPTFPERGGAITKAVFRSRPITIFGPTQPEVDGQERGSSRLGAALCRQTRSPGRWTSSISYRQVSKQVTPAYLPEGRRQRSEAGNRHRTLRDFLKADRPADHERPKYVCVPVRRTRRLQNSPLDMATGRGTRRPSIHSKFADRDYCRSAMVFDERSRGPGPSSDSKNPEIR